MRRKSAPPTRPWRLLCFARRRRHLRERVSAVSSGTEPRERFVGDLVRLLERKRKHRTGLVAPSRIATELRTPCGRGDVIWIHTRARVNCFSERGKSEGREAVVGR